jgi:hypothetical protein
MSNKGGKMRVTIHDGMTTYEIEGDDHPKEKYFEEKSVWLVTGDRRLEMRRSLLCHLIICYGDEIQDLAREQRAEKERRRRHRAKHSDI